MNIALCYDQVLPARGGCATYITDLARRLVTDGHEVHLYACVWEAASLPAGIRYHAIPGPQGPRFLRPWQFGAACEEAICSAGHDVSVGFDKTWGQDVLYPQGGLHLASVAHNLNKHSSPMVRGLARIAKWFDLAHWSFAALERRQYLGRHRPLIIVNSAMVRGHFQKYYGMAAADVRVLYSAIDPSRFPEQDRPRRRQAWRQRWGIRADESVGLFTAMNYRLKGLEPLLHAVRLLPPRLDFRLMVVGHRSTRRYERLARTLGVADRVRFLGSCREMAHCYFAADFLVHPTFYDPCSLVVLEALACGLPVITSRYNGASELLDPPSEGYVMDDPHDHVQLACYIEQLLDSTRRNDCARAARQRAEQWTWEHHYRQFMDILAELAARKQAA
ncbi:MAG TPA: glycosyltransferase family 4 protein [Gemmataceae bacterium]|nr:glycosyltransferase family 4 protein [Gemmataceae bacterium]